MKYLILLLALSSCSVYHRAHKSENPEVRELLESLYITRENPENNLPNEADSLKKQIILTLKNQNYETQSGKPLR